VDVVNKCYFSFVPRPLSLDFPPGTLDYYLICDESCYANPFANAQFNASQSLETIDLFRLSIENYTAVNQGPGSGVGPIQVCAHVYVCVSMCVYVCMRMWSDALRMKWDLWKEMYFVGKNLSQG